MSTPGGEHLCRGDDHDQHHQGDNRCRDLAVCHVRNGIYEPTRTWLAARMATTSRMRDPARAARARYLLDCAPPGLATICAERAVLTHRRVRSPARRPVGGATTISVSGSWAICVGPWTTIVAWAPPPCAARTAIPPGVSPPRVAVAASIVVTLQDVQLASRAPDNVAADAVAG